MPGMKLMVFPGPTPHTACHKDIGIDILIMAMLTDYREKRRQLCITEITHMEDGLLPGDTQWEWAIL